MKEVDRIGHLTSTSGCTLRHNGVSTIAQGLRQNNYSSSGHYENEGRTSHNYSYSPSKRDESQTGVHRNHDYLHSASSSRPYVHVGMEPGPPRDRDLRPSSSKPYAHSQPEGRGYNNSDVRLPSSSKPYVHHQREGRSERDSDIRWPSSTGPIVRPQSEGRDIRGPDPRLSVSSRPSVHTESQACISRDRSSRSLSSSFPVTGVVRDQEHSRSTSSFPQTEVVRDREHSRPSTSYTTSGIRVSLNDSSWSSSLPGPSQPGVPREYSSPVSRRNTQHGGKGTFHGDSNSSPRRNVAEVVAPRDMPGSSSRVYMEEPRVSREYASSSSRSNTIETESRTSVNVVFSKPGARSSPHERVARNPTVVPSVPSNHCTERRYSSSNRSDDMKRKLHAPSSSLHHRSSSDDIPPRHSRRTSTTARQYDKSDRALRSPPRPRGARCRSPQPRYLNGRPERVKRRRSRSDSRSRHKRRSRSPLYLPSPKKMHVPETPLPKSGSNRKGTVRCKEYYEKGLCLRGDLCQFDHGKDPVVLDNMTSWPPTGDCSNHNHILPTGSSTVIRNDFHSRPNPPELPQYLPPLPQPRLPLEDSLRHTLSNGETEYALAFNMRQDSNENTNSGDEDEVIPAWFRCAPDDLYYSKESNGESLATARAIKIISKFETNLVNRAKALRLEAEKLGVEKMAELIQSNTTEKERKASGSCANSDSGDSSSSDSDSSDSSSSQDEAKPLNRTDKANQELQRRTLHPRRLHKELWHNDPGLMNDGPVCRCSPKARRFGIRHGFYPGETPFPPCNKFSNNPTLYHYKITVTPLKNFVVDKSTVIVHDGHEYKFEGFSVLSHYKVTLRDLPPCSVIRFNIRYDISVVEEKPLDSFCVAELDILSRYLFTELLELVDLKFGGEDDENCCPNYHVFPRFSRNLPENGKELLPVIRVLLHLMKHDKDILPEEDLTIFHNMDNKEWQTIADAHKGMIVAKWGMKPAALRVDQIDREVADEENDGVGCIPFPVIVHFGIRPPQLSYAGNAEYQRCWRRYVKYRHLLSNMPKPSAEDRRKLFAKEIKLQEMRTKSSMKRDVTVAVSSKGFRTTGICCDVVQHAMLIPVLIGHLRFHRGLSTLEQTLSYEFKTRYLLQLALTHPSYRENFGTNPDHARNAITNCGIRQPEYGDRMIHYDTTRKRGINTLISIMSKFGESEETESGITHNERLEFLGDAVVEFITSIHLFHLFPDLEEGGLATYRAAIVQNQHLALLAKGLQLDQFMLYAHGSDLCHDSELRHAMANCFEALLGAIFLDGGIEIADRIFASTLFHDDKDLLNNWINYPKHPLQKQEPNGDRQWVITHPILKNLEEFEESIGVRFRHLRLLARALTDRSLGYTNLTCGSNQRLEFLGDTVLQLIASEYLYRFFPDHHEGHLSLLRSSLVNNRTQSLVCDELGMAKYVMRSDPRGELKTKDRADLLEAFLGALYVDQGLAPCVAFCRVCFIPRLTNSIVSQEWNDPKSKLQQCCLTLRAMNGREPDIPVYKVIESLGPTNTRIYIVAVYFRGKRLACGGGHSIQDAEMCAAASALKQSGKLFPQLRHQKKVINRTTQRRTK